MFLTVGFTGLLKLGFGRGGLSGWLCGVSGGCFLGVVEMEVVYPLHDRRLQECARVIFDAK
jgi:hypothetical protein